MTTSLYIKRRSRPDPGCFNFEGWQEIRRFKHCLTRNTGMSLKRHLYIPELMKRASVEFHRYLLGRIVGQRNNKEPVDLTNLPRTIPIGNGYEVSVHVEKDYMVNGWRYTFMWRSMKSTAANQGALAWHGMVGESEVQNAQRM